MNEATRPSQQFDPNEWAGDSDELVPFQGRPALERG